MLQMDWTVANMEEALKHYEKAIVRYRNFLAYDREGRAEVRNDANERIGRVQELATVTAEQIPELRRQKIQIEQDMKAAAEDEKRAAEEAKAAEDAAKSAPPADGAAPAVQP